jgi:lysophospholipid acyltransferase (LPLAT)-like uncharacterized protein
MSGRKRTRIGIGPSLLLAIGLPLYRAWMSTLRIRWTVPENTAEHLDRGEPVIYAIMHETLLPTPWTHRKLGLIVMVSRHRDGEIVTRILERSGFGTARGSTTRGGSTALREMIEAATAGRSLAITPDGPKGPRRRVQPGVIEIARRSGVPVIPGAITYRPAHRFRSWDRMLLPWPFAKGVIRCGELFRLTEECDTEKETERLQGVFDALFAKIEGEFDEHWRSGSRRAPHRRG